jgi:hypothetical protein
MTNPKPLDEKLYKHVKSLAKKKFKSPTGIYRSSWIVKKYKELGGKYSSRKPKTSGLKRWYKEKWVDLKRKNKDGTYAPCGRSTITKKSKYPLCRPSIRVNKSTPKTYKELSKKIISKAKKSKKSAKRISFKKKNKK